MNKPSVLKGRNRYKGSKANLEFVTRVDKAKYENMIIGLENQIKDHFMPTLSATTKQLRELCRENGELKQLLATERCQNYVLKPVICERDIKLQLGDEELQSDLLIDGIDIADHETVAQTNEERIASWNDTSTLLQLFVEDMKKYGLSKNTLPKNLQKVEEYQSRNMAEQTARMQSIIADGFIPSLISSLPNIEQRIETSKAQSELHRTEYAAMVDQYESAQQRRKRLVTQLEQAIDECNEQIDKENLCLRRISQQQRDMDSMQRQHEQLESVSARYSSLISAYDAFEEETEENVRKIKKQFEQWWALFESRWQSWSVEDMISWFQHQTRHIDTTAYICDWDTVRAAIEKRNINGKSLKNFSESTLDLIGIYDFDTANHLMKAITTLRNIGVESDLSDGAGHTETPSSFKCSLTGQIMNDPVMASDGKIYEREAIMRVNSNGTSTQETSPKLYQQRQLRREIEAYLKKNVQTNEGAAQSF